MKKLLYLAVAYQVFLVTRATGSGAESLLAARAITQGQVPYRDFMIHIGPLPAYLFAGLMSVPKEAWWSLVFIGFNLLSAWGLYKLSQLHFTQTMSYAVCALFLFVVPLFGGNEMFPEVMVCTFGVWGVYLYERGLDFMGLFMFMLGAACKQTAILFLIAILMGGAYDLYRQRRSRNKTPLRT